MMQQLLSRVERVVFTVVFVVHRHVNVASCAGHGTTTQPPEDGAVPPASPRAPRDGSVPARLHAEEVPRFQGQGRHEEGKSWAHSL